MTVLYVLVGDTRVMARGHAHIVDMNTLDHPQLFSEPMQSQPDLVLWKVRIPASMKHDVYSTFAWLRVDTNTLLAGGIHPVIQIVQVYCEPVGTGAPCLASGAGLKTEYRYGYCTHGSANLQILAAMLRPCGFDQNNLSTALSCRWNHGGADSACFDPSVPAYMIQFRKPNRKRVRERKDNTASVRSDFPRSQFNPFVPSAWEFLKDWSNADRVMKRYKHYDAINTYLNSQPVREQMKNKDKIHYRLAGQGPAPGVVLMSSMERMFGRDEVNFDVQYQERAADTSPSSGRDWTAWAASTVQNPYADKLAAEKKARQKKRKQTDPKTVQKKKKPGKHASGRSS